MAECINARIGQGIRNLRHRRKMTLLTLSRRCALSIPYLSDIERGRVAPAMKTLYRIADGFEVNIHTLIPLNDWAVRDREEMVNRNG
jgi:XRE family transcriptional regulator, regulator of sulfur utilization